MYLGGYVFDDNDDFLSDGNCIVCGKPFKEIEKRLEKVCLCTGEQLAKKRSFAVDFACDRVLNRIFEYAEFNWVSEDVLVDVSEKNRVTFVGMEQWDIKKLVSVLVDYYPAYMKEIWGLK